MILLTGATGLLGSQILCDLLGKGYKVRVLLRRKSNRDFIYKRLRENNLNQECLVSVEWVEGDLSNVPLLYDIVKDVDFVIHAAALVSFDSKDKLLMKKINHIGTRNVVNACLEFNIKKLMYVSSIATLGRMHNGEVITELTCWNESNKNSYYSKTKNLAELEVWRGVAEGLDAVIINPSIILGEGDWDKGSSALFKTVYKGNKFYTLGMNGFVDVKDVSKALIKLMESDVKNQRFIVSGYNLRYKELFEMIAKSLKVSPPRIKANIFLSEVVWRLLAVLSFVTGRKPFITREMSGTANSVYKYSSDKLITTIDFKYTPIEESVKRISNNFISDIKQKNKN